MASVIAISIFIDNSLVLIYKLIILKGFKYIWRKLDSLNLYVVYEQRPNSF